MGSWASARGVHGGSIRAPWVPTTHPHHKGGRWHTQRLCCGEILPSFGGVRLAVVVSSKCIATFNPRYLMLPLLSD